MCAYSFVFIIVAFVFTTSTITLPFTLLVLTLRFFCLTSTINVHLWGYASKFFEPAQNALTLKKNALLKRVFGPPLSIPAKRAAHAQFGTLRAERKMKTVY